MDPTLLSLCQRDEMLALLADARRAHAQGDRQAGFVEAWMTQALEAMGQVTTAPVEKAPSAPYPGSRADTKLYSTRPFLARNASGSEQE